jgi:hypothetical protein
MTAQASGTDSGARMRKMKKAIVRIFRSLIGARNYTTYDPPFPGDGI